MTRDDRYRLAVLLGVPLLGAHAVAAGWVAKMFLSLPIEAGGLFFGPVLGMPLAIGAAMLVAAAVMLATARDRNFAMAALFVVMAIDGFAFMVGGPLAPWAVLGALLAATSFVLVLSAVDLRV